MAHTAFVVSRYCAHFGVEGAGFGAGLVRANLDRARGGRCASGTSEYPPPVRTALESEFHGDAAFLSSLLAGKAQDAPPLDRDSQADEPVGRPG
jgi:hypothetical protein